MFYIIALSKLVFCPPAECKSSIFPGKASKDLIKNILKKAPHIFAVTLKLKKLGFYEPFFSPSFCFALQP